MLAMVSLFLQSCGELALFGVRSRVLTVRACFQTDLAVIPRTLYSALSQGLSENRLFSYSAPQAEREAAEPNVAVRSNTLDPPSSLCADVTVAAAAATHSSPPSSPLNTGHGSAKNRASPQSIPPSSSPTQTGEGKDLMGQRMKSDQVAVLKQVKLWSQIDPIKLFRMSFLFQV